LPEVANVSTQVTPVLPNLATITDYFASIVPDFTTVSAQLLSRSSFAPVLPIFAHVRSCFTAVLFDLVAIASNLFPVRPYFLPIRAQFPALGRFKFAGFLLLGQSRCRQTRNQGRN
jgi:hypothetical protein